MKNYFIKHGFEKSQNGHILRIHELHWMEIDKYGFVEIRRKIEYIGFESEKIRRFNSNEITTIQNRVTKVRYEKITLPKPIRSEQSLINLLVGLQIINTKSL